MLTDGSETKVMKLRWAGTCADCGVVLPQGLPARWDKAARQTTCVACPAAGQAAAGPPEAAKPPVAAPAAPLVAARAGGSAQAEHDRRHDKRSATLDARWGRLAGIAKFLSDDPQSTKAWAKGAEGERRLAAHLERELGDTAVFLHDRKYRTWNIDHLVVAGSGVWVVDAKSYSGRVEHLNKGRWLGPTDNRIYVGGRDRTKCAKGLEWQVTAVKEALGDLEVPVHAALCFVNGENWGILTKPFRHEGVLVVWASKLAKIIAESSELGPEQVEAVARRLGERLKPAT